MLLADFPGILTFTGYQKQRDQFCKESGLFACNARYRQTEIFLHWRGFFFLWGLRRSLNWSLSWRLLSLLGILFDFLAF